MAIECYDDKCPYHSTNHGLKGPFCYEEECKNKTYDVSEVIEAGYNLTPIICRKCGSLEVTFNQGIGDAYCASCETWQLDIKKKRVPK